MTVRRKKKKRAVLVVLAKVVYITWKKGIRSRTINHADIGLVHWSHQILQFQWHSSI